MILGFRVVVTAALAVTLTACGGSSDDDRGDTRTSGAPAPIIADISTRAAAQTLVDEAGDRLLDDGTGRYELTWGAGRLQTREVGDYSIHDFATRTTTAAPTEDSNFTTEIIYLGAEAFGRSYISGHPEGCWDHVSRGEGEEARTLAYPQAVIMVFRPKVRGFVKGGARSDVVVDVMLRDVASAALPSFVRAHEGEVPDKATVPARVTIVDGVYRSLSYRMIDVLDGLKDAGLEVKAGSDVPPRAFDRLPKELVSITYTRGGADVDIKRPPPENVTKMDGAEPCERLPLH